MINFWEKVMAALSPCIHMPHRVCTNGNCCLKGINYSDPFRHVYQLYVLDKKISTLVFSSEFRIFPFHQVCFSVWHVKIFTGMCNKGKWKSFALLLKIRPKGEGNTSFWRAFFEFFFQFAYFLKASFLLSPPSMSSSSAGIIHQTRVNHV